MNSTYTAKNQEIKLHEGGILYRDALGVERGIAWDELEGVKKSVFSRNVYLRGKNGSIPLRFLPEEKQRDVIRQLYTMWRTRDDEAAKKNAFDFVDHNRGFAWVAFFMSVFFFLPVGTVQLQDSISQWRCNRLLRQESAWTEATVTKAKKKKENGQYFITFNFTVDGQQVDANDQYFTTKDADVVPAAIPVLYSPSKPTCWILGSADHKPQWEKRRFFSTYVAMFGFVLAAIGLVGFLWSIFRFREKNPYAAAVRELFQFR